MRHIQPFTCQRPIMAQDDNGEGGGGLLLKSLLSFLLFGINPLFLIFFGAKTGDNNNGNGEGGGSR